MASLDGNVPSLQNWGPIAGRRVCALGLDGVSYNDHFLSFSSEQASRLRLKQIKRMLAAKETAPSQTQLTSTWAPEVRWWPGTAPGGEDEAAAQMPERRARSQAGRCSAEPQSRDGNRKSRQRSSSAAGRGSASRPTAYDSDASTLGEGNSPCPHSSSPSLEDPKRSRRNSRRSTSPSRDRHAKDIQTDDGEASLPPDDHRANRRRLRLNKALEKAAGPSRSASAPVVHHTLRRGVSQAAAVPSRTLAEVPYQPRASHASAAQLTGAALHSTTATLAGEACNPAQQRLADPKSFTGFYRWRFDRSHPSHAHDPASGDYCAEPIRASRMLMNRTAPELDIPTRACDFRAETGWRLSLRPSRPESAA